MKRSSGRFELLYTKTAARDIKKLDPVSKKKIKKKLKLYSQKPLSYANKLIKSSLGSYRWRIGSYRVIFDIRENKIIILRVGHRKEIYR